jgi:hypothetical protein
LDQTLYKVIAEHPKGDVKIVVKNALFTPKADGNYTVLKADVVDFLEQELRYKLLYDER